MALDFLAFPTEVSTLDYVTYQYFHQLLNKRTVVWTSEVDETFIEKVYLPLRDFEHDEIQEPVTLILNSVGGNVAEGFFVAHYLSQYKKPLNIIVCGYAASMAAIVLAAGGHNSNITRSCYPSTYVMLHDGQIELPMMEAKSAADCMAFQEKTDQDIRDFVIQNTNISPELYDAHSRHQWFISATEAKELNLIDKIIGVDD